MDTSKFEIFDETSVVRRKSSWQERVRRGSRAEGCTGSSPGRPGATGPVRGGVSDGFASRRVGRTGAGEDVEINRGDSARACRTCTGRSMPR